MKNILIATAVFLWVAVSAIVPLREVDGQGAETIENPDVAGNPESTGNTTQGILENKQGAENNKATDENINDVLSQIKSQPEQERSGGVTILPPGQGQVGAPAQYASREIIVKLKDGKSLSDIAELNSKYGVISTTKVFETPPQEVPQAQEGNVTNATEASKEEGTGEGTGHDKWYWELDKESQEYKEHAAKVEKDKQGFLERLSQKEGKPPEETAPVSLEDVYLLKFGGDVSIPTIVQEYASHPAVEYAEPNYMAKAEQPQGMSE